jgi:predicted nucleotidyltransferase
MVIHRVFDEVFRNGSNVSVLRSLLDTSTGFSGNEVARVSGIHPRTAFKALTLLEELGIVRRQRGGRDHIFSLNREHFLFGEAIVKIFQVESDFREEIIKTLASILKRHVYSALIFGSAARREEKPLSDLDVCCIINLPTERLFVSDLLNKKSPMLYKKFGIRVASIFFSKKQFMKKRKSKLIQSIAKEGILITGKHPKGLLNG